MHHGDNVNLIGLDAVDNAVRPLQNLTDIIALVLWNLVA